MKKTKSSKRKPSQSNANVTAKKSINTIPSKSSTHYLQILPGKWQWNAGIFALLFLSTLLLYSGDLQLGFFRIDDQQYVVKNPWIRAFSSENISYILTKPYFVNYSPLHLFSYMIDYSINGADPYIFHLSSNIWAGIVAGFVFLVALALTGRYMIAIPAAVLFVVHPAHVEAVAWISSRKDLIAAAFALPSLLAYLKYRKGGMSSRKWYIISIVLFVMALLGKLSVATFPIVFLCIDLFIEKRRFSQSLMDKLPYVGVAAILAIVVAAAQPSTGSRPDPYVLLSALVQNFWLITGFGEYVIYRVAPSAQSAVIEIGSVLLMIIIFLAPLLLRRKFPLITVLIYWILFAFLPTQVLSFAYPVTDRYLFFPSVAAVIIISYGVIKFNEAFLKKSFVPAIIVMAIMALIWIKQTTDYLKEWNDPLTVWHGATKKSSDPQVYFNLGWNYMDKAARFGERPRKAPMEKEEAINFASRTWEGDSRLPALMAEWNNNQKAGQAERLFQQDLRKKAHAAFNQALVTKGNHIMPDFFFFRGLLFLDEGKLNEAQKEFMNALNEASGSSFTEGSQEVMVNSHYNLCIVAWTMGNYNEAYKWIVLAEKEQNQFGGNWIPDIAVNRQKLEQILRTQPSR